jgi:hypothetical protein
MKRLLTLTARFLAIYFLSLALALWLVEEVGERRAWADPISSGVFPTETSFAPGGAKPCKPCSEGWLSITFFFGGIECNHGPGSGCPSLINFVPSRDCFEANGGLPAINGSICRCFECGDPGCHYDFLLWFAWCDYEDFFHKDGVCNIIKDGTINRYMRQSQTLFNEACDFGNNGYEGKKWCGYDKTDHFGCQSSNCRGYGNWIPGFQITKYRCRPPHGDPPVMPPAPTATWIP